MESMIFDMTERLLRDHVSHALRFDDPDIGIDWGIDPAAAILSDKDAAAPYLAAIESPFVFDEGRR